MSSNDEIDLLRESERIHRDIFNRSPMGFFRTNMKGEILMVNDRLLEILKFPALKDAQSVGLMNMYVDPVRRQQLLDALKSAGRVNAFEIALYDSEKMPHVFHLYGAILKNADGVPDFIEGHLLDITDRRRDEERRANDADQFNKMQNTIIELSRLDALSNGDLLETAKALTRTASDVMDVGRASVWLLRDSNRKLESVDLFLKDEKNHVTGIVLDLENYPAYLKALISGRAIDAHDARTDSRTSEFTEGYLKPLGITSMLDAAIRQNREVVGCVCLEQVGPRRNWSSNEISFVGSLGDIFSQALLNADRARRDAEQRSMLDRLKDQIEIIQQQKDAISQMSTPILQIWEGVLVLPIVGIVDTERSADMTDKLLDAVVSHRARGVLIDITGIDVLDTKTADHFIKMAKAVRLLGAQAVITGISPAIAQTLTHIDVDLTGIETLRSLRDGLVWFLGADAAAV